MLVRKCDVCNHIIIGDEVGYMVDISTTSMLRGADVRTITLDTTVEICSECAQAMFAALNERITFEKKEEQGDEQMTNKEHEMPEAVDKVRDDMDIIDQMRKLLPLIEDT